MILGDFVSAEFGAFDFDERLRGLAEKRFRRRAFYDAGLAEPMGPMKSSCRRAPG